MLSIFAIPKRPVEERLRTIQRNAIESWMRLNPEWQILLFIEDPIMDKQFLDQEVDLYHDFARNEFGTPLISDVFSKAVETSKHDVLCYVNADIILLSDFVDAVQSVARTQDNFLMIGQRLDLEVDRAIQFEGDWERRLRRAAKERGILHSPLGIDYFVFSRDVWAGSPGFAVGRPGWDNWFVKQTLRRGVTVIDASTEIVAIHQNHDYTHVPRGNGVSYEGPEAAANRVLAGEDASAFHIWSAHFVLHGGQVRRALDWKHLEARALSFLNHRPLVSKLLGSLRHPLKSHRNKNK